MHLKSLIFDLDGTVLANEAVFGKAFGSVLQEIGINIKTTYPHFGGIGVEENWMGYCEKYGLDKNKVSEYSKKTLDNYYKHLDQISVKPGFFELISAAKKENLKIALATSSTSDILEKVFEEIPIKELFDVTVSGDEVKNKKPDPAIFLLALQRLSLDSMTAVVFEDSEAGVESAKSANIKTVAIFRDENHKSELRQADAFYPNFSGISLEYLNSLVMGIN